MTTEHLIHRANALRLHGLASKLSLWADQPWVEPLLAAEEQERSARGLARRLRDAQIGPFKPMSDFDWHWAASIDRQQLEDLFTFEWLTHKNNVILMGPNGVGKTMIARNLAHQAALRGHSVRVCSAGQLLGELREQDSVRALNTRLRRYTTPQLLVIDEVGYLSYDPRAADLLFEVINRRYEQAATVITTNKPFAEWSDVFPNAACVVTLIDRLVHHAEIVQIEARSFRLKEAEEQRAQRAQARHKRTPATRT
jgi:DNA replication protein DnaC